MSGADAKEVGLEKPAEINVPHRTSPFYSL
jgi:hypothetical protein